MFPYVNPLIERERRMKAGEIERRINGAKNLLYNNTVAAAGNRLSLDELDYISYLCGMATGSNNLNPEQKARIGNLFEQTWRKFRKRLESLPANAMPGLKAVHENRDAVTKLHKENAKRKRKASGN